MDDKKQRKQNSQGTILHQPRPGTLANKTKQFHRFLQDSVTSISSFSKCDDHLLILGMRIGVFSRIMTQR